MTDCTAELMLDLINAPLEISGLFTFAAPDGSPAQINFAVRWDDRQSKWRGGIAWGGPLTVTSDAKT